MNNSNLIQLRNTYKEENCSIKQSSFIGRVNDQCLFFLEACSLMQYYNILSNRVWDITGSSIPQKVLKVERHERAIRALKLAGNTLVTGSEVSGSALGKPIMVPTKYYMYVCQLITIENSQLQVF